jgi:ariadne-1
LIIILLFQANQKDLESSTEKLSEYLERDISIENLVDIKQKVQDKYRYWNWTTLFIDDTM